MVLTPYKNICLYFDYIKRLFSCKVVSKFFSFTRIENYCIISFVAMRKWLSGRASPCQGEGRGFESRLPLHFLYAGVAELADAQDLKSCGGCTTVSVRVRPSAPSLCSFRPEGYFFASVKMDGGFFLELTATRSYSTMK
jgi:hypothetical protein